MENADGEVHRIIEGVEYTVVSNSARSVPGDRAEDTAAKFTGDSRAYGATDKYVRALQTFSDDRADHMAALEVVILGWLDAKRGRSGSQRTWRTYADTLSSFRAALQREKLDLDGPVTPVTLIAQAWAGSGPGSKSISRKNFAPPTPMDDPDGRSAAGSSSVSALTREPAPTTYNQRLASVSSFYKYARKQGILDDNPIERVERRRVQAYAGSRALEGSVRTENSQSPL